MSGKMEMTPEDIVKIQQLREYFGHQLENLIKSNADAFSQKHLFPAIVSALCGAIASMCCSFESAEATRLSFRGAIDLLNEMFEAGINAKNP